MPGYKFDPARPTSRRWSATHGAERQMLSFPLNSSTTVLNYNKGLFKKAGLTPTSRPRPGLSWCRPPAKLKARAWPARSPPAGGLDAAGELLHRHNTLFATQGNGFWRHQRAPDLQQPLHVRHIENLANMARGGPVPVPRPRQPRRRAVLLASARWPRPVVDLREHQEERQVRVRHRPALFTPDVPGTPQNTVIGGASPWVMSASGA